LSLYSSRWMIILPFQNCTSLPSLYFQVLTWSHWLARWCIRHIWQLMECSLQVYVCVEVEVKLRPTVSRLVCLGVRHPSGTRDQFFFLLEIFFRQLRVCYFIAHSLTRGRFCNLLYIRVYINTYTWRWGVFAFFASRNAFAGMPQEATHGSSLIEDTREGIPTENIHKSRARQWQSHQLLRRLNHHMEMILTQSAYKARFPFDLTAASKRGK
jgi:hypothetical protein